MAARCAVRQLLGETSSRCVNHRLRASAFVIRPVGARGTHDAMGRIYSAKSACPRPLPPQTVVIGDRQRADRRRS